MKVFYSWSGDKSRQIAERFSIWLPGVIQSIHPFFSSEIDKGERWGEVIAEELEHTAIGLLFLTRDNLEAPWLMFEAGAISKKVGQAKVMPILFGIETTDLKGPLTQFQATMFNKVEMHKLFVVLNAGLDGGGLASNLLDATFSKWWPEIEDGVKGILDKENPTPPIRKDRDLLEEVLQISRATARQLVAQANEKRQAISFKLGDRVKNINHGFGKIAGFKTMEDGLVGVLVKYDIGKIYGYSATSTALQFVLLSTDDDMDESDPFADE